MVPRYLEAQRDGYLFLCVENHWIFYGIFLSKLPDYCLSVSKSFRLLNRSYSTNDKEIVTDSDILNFVEMQHHQLDFQCDVKVTSSTFNCISAH